MIKRKYSIPTFAGCSLFLLSSIIQTTAATNTEVISNIPVNSDREAYFGDLHLHTNYSFDAFVFGAQLGPEDGYRFAKGEPITYLGETVKRRAPLDFLAISDHAENIGVFNDIDDPESAIATSPMGALAKKLKQYQGLIPPSEGAQLTGTILKFFHSELPPEFKILPASAWDRMIDYANEYYEPGKFTTFIAYEWTSQSDGANLHRNIIFKGDSAPAPFTAADSSDPQDLWVWLETIRSQGNEALAIPHNGNASNGLMYDWNTLQGKKIDRAYAELRQANEPLSEIAQIKGAGETHPLLSSRDEFANFEIRDVMLASPDQKSKPTGSYVRDALSRGLVLQKSIGINPYKDGIVGGSDLHGGLSISSQEDYAGNIAGANIGPGQPSKEQAKAILSSGENLNQFESLKLKLAAKVPAFVTLDTTSGALTGAWAESNSRESIYAALRRKEVFATSGNRLKVRFFGGWELDKALPKQDNWIQQAYKKAVPMGSDLTPSPQPMSSPNFIVWALKDPNAANLDRIQIVKVWEDAGQQKEKVFDVVWSGDRKANTKSGKVALLSSKIDPVSGEYNENIGATTLMTVWTDPEFDATQLAAYYARVLEIPTPRWSTLLAIKNNLPLPKGVEPTVQQRAWSSPIWYSPNDLPLE